MFQVWYHIHMKYHIYAPQFTKANLTNDRPKTTRFNTQVSLILVQN